MAQADGIPKKRMEGVIERSGKGGVWLGKMSIALLYPFLFIGICKANGAERYQSGTLCMTRFEFENPIVFKRGAMFW